MSTGKKGPCTGDGQHSELVKDEGKADGERERTQDWKCKCPEAETQASFTEKKAVTPVRGARRQLLRGQADGIRASWKGMVIPCTVKVQAAEMGWEMIQVSLSHTQTHSAQVLAAVGWGLTRLPLRKLKCQRKCCDQLAVTLGKHTPPLCWGLWGQRREVKSSVSRASAWIRAWLVSTLTHAHHGTLLTPRNPGGASAHRHQYKMLHPPESVGNSFL